MNTIDHPQAQSFRHALAQGPDEGTIAAYVDWLQDQNASEADLLLTYRGSASLNPLASFLAPTFNEDEGLRLVLARWLQAREPGRAAPVHPRDRGRDCTLILLHEAVRMCEMDLIREVAQLISRMDWNNGRAPSEEDYLYVGARARRAHKRRVLQLFRGSIPDSFLPPEKEILVAVNKESVMAVEL